MAESIFSIAFCCNPGYIFFWKPELTMNLHNRSEIYFLSNRIELRLDHFARGVWPLFDPRPTCYATNRLLFFLENPNGESNYIADARERLALTPGTMILIPIFHPATVRMDEQVRFVSIHFHLEFASGIDLFADSGRLFHEARPELAGRLDAGFASEQRLALALRLRRTVYEVACDLFEQDGWKSCSAAARFAPYTELLNYLARHCTAQTGVEDLARRMHMSRSGFSRRFTRDTGIAPGRFLARRLLGRATELLHQPRATVREVAAELEFSSEFVFSRFFRREAGISPGKFQRRSGMGL